MRNVILCVVLLLACSTAVPASEEPLAVGVVLPLSGHTANFGTEALRGINLAAEIVNEQGGIRKRHLQLMVRDDRADPAQTSREVSSLITRDTVMAVVGALTSNCAAAAAAVAQQAKTPLVLPTATAPYVTEIGDYICRICFTDPLQSKVLAEFARQSLVADRAAIIYESGSPYSEKLAEFFAIYFQDMGGSVVYSRLVKQDSEELLAAVDQALAEDPHVLFVPVYYPEAAVVIKRVAAQASDVILLGADGWESAELFKLAGEQIRPGKVYVSSHFSLEYQRQHNSPFIRRFEQVYGESPNSLSALGYDAVMVLADALRRTTTTDRLGLREALVTTHDFRGVTGTISINEKRNVAKDIFILKAEPNRFVHETMISAY